MRLRENYEKPYIMDRLTQDSHHYAASLNLLVFGILSRFTSNWSPEVADAHLSARLFRVGEKDFRCMVGINKCRAKDLGCRSGQQSDKLKPAIEFNF